jgi:hypothetical protein
MQGDACCVLFELFHSIEVKQVKTRILRTPKGFGTPHGLGEPRLELVVWNYSPCRQVNRKRDGD